MGLVDFRGRPISSANERNEARRGDQVDAYALPNGAIVSKVASFALHNRIKNDTLLRERLETAARMTGRTTLHLDLLRHGNKHATATVEKAIEKNLEFGEKIQSQRIADKAIPETKAGYENLKNCA